MISDAAVLRITHEGITNYDSLLDFDKKIIQILPSTCKEKTPAIASYRANGIAVEPEIPGVNISTISVQRLITSYRAVNYYAPIRRAINGNNMHYQNVLINFKLEYEEFCDLKNHNESSVPKMNDRDGYRKVICWPPIIADAMSRAYGSKRSLSYVLRTNSTVPTEADDPLNTNEAGVINSYFGRSGSLVEELIAQLPHDCPIFKNENATIFAKIEESIRGISVESTIKSFARRKDGRDAYEALIANRAGNIKYRAMNKELKYWLK